MLLVGLSTTKKDGDKTKNNADSKLDSAANVVFSTDFAFIKRLRTALKAIEADKNSRRLIIEIPDFPQDLDPDEMGQDQWYQHLAVLLLDAFCAVFSK